MRVGEPQIYRETAFERDGRHSNENAPRVYLQRPTSQAEADVAEISTPIIMPRPPRRSCTDQSKSYTFSSDDDDDMGVDNSNHHNKKSRPASLSLR